MGQGRGGSPRGGREARCCGEDDDEDDGEQCNVDDDKLMVAGDHESKEGCEEGGGHAEGQS